MSIETMIVLARAIHVGGGVIWAGGVFLLTVAIMPFAVAHPEAGRWMGLTAQRAGPIFGISAALTVVSGIYLYWILHPHNLSAGTSVLATGAIAGLLAFVIGFLVARPIASKMAQLSQRIGNGAPSTQSTDEMTVLCRRMAVSSRLILALLAISVLAMGVFRYAQGLA